jgi:Domain of unknown function (DUF4185)
MSPTKAAAHAGRIGALVVSLGIGMAVGTGVAWADSSESSTSKSSPSESDASAKSSPKQTSSSASRDSTTPKPRKPVVSRSAAAGTDGAARGFKPAHKIADAVKRAAGASVEADGAPAASHPHVDSKTSSSPTTPKSGRPTITLAVPSTRPAASSMSQAAGPEPAPMRNNAVTAAQKVVDSVSQGVASPRIPDSAVSTAEPVTLTAAAQPDPAVTSERVVPRLVSNLLAAVGFAPHALNAPVVPAETPPLWMLLAAARRELERSVNPARSSISAQPSVVTAAAVVTTPTTLPSKEVGWVTGPGITDGFNIGGTDLGILWENGLTGKIQLAFGDTFSDTNMSQDWRSNVLLLSTDTTLYNGLQLLQTGPAYQFIPSAPSALGPLGSEVTVIPTSAVSVNNEQYVNYMSVKSWDRPGRWTTNYSAISMYDQSTDTWVLVPLTIRSAGWLRSSTPYRPGDQNFQQAAYVLEPEDQVGPGETRYLYAFGTPSGRAGSAYLSRVPEDDVTDLSKYEYWDGSEWVQGNAAVAVPVIGDSTHSKGIFGFVVDWANNPNVFGGYLGGLFGAKTGGNVSEMSVQYNEYLGKYVVLYADGHNNVQLRTADEPEGPWSDPITIATSRQYPGLYAPMIHPWSGTGKLTDANGDPDVSNLYWDMSIWGNYNVVLMQTDLSPLNTVMV